MSIHSSVIDSMQYKGTATFSFRTKDSMRSYQIHNTGTQHLFDIITQFLAGYDVKQNIPTYIDIQKDNTSVLKRFLHITGVVWGPAAINDYDVNSGIGYLKLTATLMNDDKSAVSSLGSNAQVKILDKTGEELCVIQSSLVSELWESVDSNTDGIIEWLLEFGNSTR